MDFFELRAARGEIADEESERFATLAIGASIEVHEALGPGHAEKVYEAALCHELDLRGIPYQRQVPVMLFYKGKQVGEGWIDILVGDRLVLELKSVEQLVKVHRGQVVAYLAATKLRLGLLMNFNVEQMRQGIKRVVRDPRT